MIGSHPCAWPWIYLPILKIAATLLCISIHCARVAVSVLRPYWNQHLGPNLMHYRSRPIKSHGHADSVQSLNSFDILSNFTSVISVHKQQLLCKISQKWHMSHIWCLRYSLLYLSLQNAGAAHYPYSGSLEEISSRSHYCWFCVESDVSSLLFSSSPSLVA